MATAYAVAVGGSMANVTIFYTTPSAAAATATILFMKTVTSWNDTLTRASCSAMGAPALWMCPGCGHLHHLPVIQQSARPFGEHHAYHQSARTVFAANGCCLVHRHVFFRPCGLGHLAVQSWRFAPGGRAPWLPERNKALPKSDFCAIKLNEGLVKRFGSIFLRFGLQGHWRLTIICLLCSRKPACAPCWRHCGIKQRIWDFGWTLRRAALCSRSSLTRSICCSTL